jgi:hypothetical protein
MKMEGKVGSGGKMKTERCAFFRHPVCLGAMVLWILGLVSSAFAWPDAVAQGPSPESEKLSFLVGTWKIERAAHKTAYQPAEERQSTIQTGEWLYGRRYVLCLLGQTASTGPYLKVSIFGYDPEAGTYFCDVYMGMGQRTYYTGTRAGNTWTFVSDSKDGGKTFKFRWTIVGESPSLITSKLEYSEDGGPWILASEAKWTRI